MPDGDPGVVEELSGVSQQLTPDQSQITDGETQVSTLPPAEIIPLVEPDKRIAPSPTGQYPGEAGEAITEEAGGVTAEEAAAAAPPVQIALPILRWTRYVGTDTSFVQILSWDIPSGYVGDLHEFSLVSSNDDKTRWRITIGGFDQVVPQDRTLLTPITPPWRDTILPGPTQVLIEALSVDGTSITIDAMISGTLRFGG
jgi:hypothetical protein